MGRKRILKTVNAKAPDQGFFVRMPDDAKNKVEEIIERHKDIKLSRSELISFLIYYFDSLSLSEQTNLIISRGEVASYLSRVVQMQFTLQEADSSFAEGNWIRSEIIHRRLRKACVELVQMSSDARKSGSASQDEIEFQRLLSWTDYRLGHLWVNIAEMARNTALESWCDVDEPAEDLIGPSYDRAIRSLALSQGYSRAAGGSMRVVGRFNAVVADCLWAQWQVERALVLGELSTGLEPIRSRFCDKVKECLEYLNTNKSRVIISDFVIIELIDNKCLGKGEAGLIRNIILPKWEEARTELQSVLDEFGGQPGDDNPDDISWYGHSLMNDVDLKIFRDCSLTKDDFKKVTWSERTILENVARWIETRISLGILDRS
jgi:hypothetical protein